MVSTPTLLVGRDKLHQNDPTPQTPVHLSLTPNLYKKGSSLVVPKQSDYIFWVKSGHCLARQSLYRLRNKGAARLAQLFTVYSKTARPDWVDMERQVVPSCTLDFLLWCPPILSPSLSHALAIWDTLRNSPSLVSQSKPLAHIFCNLEFRPGIDIRAFQWWLDKGMYRIGHYFTSALPTVL